MDKTVEERIAEARQRGYVEGRRFSDFLRLTEVLTSVGGMGADDDPLVLLGHEVKGRLMEIARTKPHAPVSFAAEGPNVSLPVDAARRLLCILGDAAERASKDPGLVSEIRIVIGDLHDALDKVDLTRT